MNTVLGTEKYRKHLSPQEETEVRCLGKINHLKEALYMEKLEKMHTLRRKTHGQKRHEKNLSLHAGLI